MRLFDGAVAFAGEHVAEGDGAESASDFLEELAAFLNGVPVHFILIMACFRVNWKSTRGTGIPAEEGAPNQGRHVECAPLR